MELDPRVSPEEIMSREVELGCERWTFSLRVTHLPHVPTSTAVQRTLSLRLCPSTAVETAIAQCTSRWALARGHRLNTSIVLAAVHGLSGLFSGGIRGRAFTLSPSFPPVPAPNKPLASQCGRKAKWSRERTGPNDYVKSTLSGTSSVEQNLTLSAGKDVTLATNGRHRVDGDVITLCATSARGSRPSCSGARGCGWTASDRSCRRHTDSCREDTSCKEDTEDIDICLTVCSCVHTIWDHAIQLCTVSVGSRYSTVYCQYGITLFNCVLSVWDHAVQLCTVSMGSLYSTVYCIYGITLFNCVLSILDHAIQLRTVNMGSCYSTVYCQYGITLFNCVLWMWDHTIQLCTVNVGSHY